MTTAKLFFTFLFVSLFSLTMSAQVQTDALDLVEANTMVQIQDLHNAASTRLLTTKNNGEVALSESVYNTEEIPASVSKMILETLLADEALAQEVTATLLNETKAPVQKSLEPVLDQNAIFVVQNDQEVYPSTDTASYSGAGL